MSRLHVVVDSRFERGTNGGVETFIVGLAQGLSELSFTDVRVNFLTFEGQDSWTTPFLGGGIEKTAVVKSAPHPLASRSRLWAVRPSGGSIGVLPPRDPIFERLGAEVVHFPKQSGKRTSIPSIYQPHDLQHKHLPDFFSRRRRAARDVVYRDLCRRAAHVVVGTSWVKRDLVHHYGIDEDRIQVIPLAPVITEAPAPGTHHLPDLPAHYVVYPAVPWPHKNHLRLFEALAYLRRQGVDVPLVLTGSRFGQFPLGRAANAAGVGDLVTDLGFVEQFQLEEVIRGAALLVMPTLFESASFPVWEAFRLGTPVACSDVTSLPQQVGSAGVLFDPTSVSAMAEAIRSIWTDQQLAARLAAAGRQRVASFTWEETASRFLALYRRAGGRELVAADRAMLDSVPVL